MAENPLNRETTRHENIVHRLTEILTEISHQSPQGRPESLEGTRNSRSNNDIRNLFPSLSGSTSRRNIGSTGSRAGSASINNQDGENAAFDRRQNYGPTRRSRQTRNDKPYDRSGRSVNHRNKVGKEVCKDIMLLPHPDISTVPRFKRREELYARELVASAVTIRSDSSESEIRNLFNELFAQKLELIPGEKFMFVRAVGNKIVKPVVNRPWDGKMVKHVAGQGPIYIRSLVAIENDFAWVDENVDSASDSGNELLPDEILHAKTEPTETQQSQPRSTILGENANTPIILEEVESDIMNNETPRSIQVESTLMCPTCNQRFSVDEIEEHADDCCEQFTNSAVITYTNLMASVPVVVPAEQTVSVQDVFEESQESVSLKDILTGVSSKVLTRTCRLNVRRKFLWEDYADGRKKPWVDPECLLKIVFVGEPAVDDGGPRREFLTEVLEHMQRKFFITEEIDGKTSFAPCESTLALSDGAFKIAGELMASSVAQGGPSPNFLSPWVYDYLSKGLESIDVHLPRLNESEFSETAKKLEAAATDEEFRTMLEDDEVMDSLNKIGYRGVPQREKLIARNKMLRSMYIKTYVECKLPMINQMALGLELFGLLHAIRKHPEVMKPLFVYSNAEINCDDFLDMLETTYSQNQAKKDKELCTFKAFSDFIQALQYGGIPECHFSVKDVLKFITGCNSMPPLGFSKKLSVTFIHFCPPSCRCRPTASTCDLQIRLPIHISSLEEMVESGLSMLSDCQGFGNL